MNAELIKALRTMDLSESCPCEYQSLCEDKECIVDQAADALEAAEKRIAELESDKKTLINVAKDKSDFHATKDAMRIADLEAQLPKEGEWIFSRGDGKTCVDGWTCSACGN